MNAQLDIASDTVVSAYHDVWHWQSKVLCIRDRLNDSTTYPYISYVDLSTGSVRPLEIEGRTDIQMVAEGQHSIAWISAEEDSVLHWTNTEDGWTRVVELPRSGSLYAKRRALLVSDSVVVITVFEGAYPATVTDVKMALRRYSPDWYEVERRDSSLFIYGEALCVDDTTFFQIETMWEDSPRVRKVTLTNDSAIVRDRKPSFAAPSRLYRDAHGRIWGAGVEHDGFGLDWYNRLAIWSSGTVVYLVTDHGIGPFREAVLHSGIDPASTVMSRAEINDVCLADSTLYITIAGVGILGGTFPHPDSMVPTRTFSVAILPEAYRLGHAVYYDALRLTDDFHGGLILSVWGKGLWWLRDLDSNPRYARLKDYIPPHSTE